MANYRSRDREAAPVAAVYPLMHALTDRATFDSTPTGTQVCLQWDHVIAMPTAAAAETSAQNCGSRTT